MISDRNKCQIVEPWVGPCRVSLFIRLIAGLAFMVISLSSFAQQEWEKDGGIPNAEIEIVKDRKITLPQADRNFDKIPPRPAEPLHPEIVYDFKNLRFNTPDFNPLIRPLKLKQEDISKIYGNYVSAGYGNYLSPYLEAYFNSKRDKNKYYGVHFFHQSFGKGPVDGKNSASGSTEVKLFGKSINRNVVTNGNINFKNRTGNFYGYSPGTDPSKDNIRQSYNVISLGAGIENSQPRDFTYSLNGSYSYLEDHYKTSENETGLQFNSGYKISEKSKATFGAEYFLISRKDSAVTYKARNLLKIKPAYVFSPIDKLWLTIGANVAVQNDTIAKKKSVHVYPNVSANYILSESVTAYAGLIGDMDKVSLHTLSGENLWVNSNIAIFHTNRSADFYSGLRGKLGRKLAMEVGFSNAILKNLYVYQNAKPDRSKFDVTYVNTNRLNLFAELGFNPGEAVKMSLRGDYYHYSSGNVYHRPTYRLAYNAYFNVYNKLWFGVDFIGQGGMKAINYDKPGQPVVSISPAVDLNFKLDYFISRKISAFLKFNNVLSNNYQVYLNYPVRGFQVIGGVSWSF
jgi:hypothetical protein